MTLKIYILFLTILLSVSCRNEEIVPDLPAEKEVVLSLQLAPNGNQQPATRAIAQNGADTSGISDLNLFVFNKNGSLLKQQYYTGTPTSVTISTSSGQRNIVVIANTGTNINTISSLNELQALYTQASSPSGMLNTSNNFVMAKQTGIITIPAPSTPGGSITVPTIYLNRLCTKITTTFSYNLNAGVSVTPVKIVLCQVPAICSYLASNSPASISQILARGDSLYNFGTAITSTSHNTAIPLFMYENLQGNNGSNTTQPEKTPATGKTGLCTYLEVTANYSSPTQSGPVVYRYYLGNNTLTNFDLARNTWYQISITFNGNGGITENSWRVNVTKLDNTILPSTLYIPYYSARNQVYNFGTTTITSTLNALSSSTQSGIVMDSTFMVMSKTDNSSSPLTLGTITANSKTYTVIMLPKGSQEFFVDVSTLDFPQNNTFGSKNYPVTQFIQVFNTGSRVGTWTARSTASWLYVGRGSDFPAFSATGTAYSWSTTSPVTPGSVMYNSTTGVFSSSATSTSIAIRCTANTGTKRSAYVIFTGNNNQELARVYVTQNPGSYPKSAVGLCYVQGGVFRPGAFNSQGNSPTPQPDGSSTTSLWVQVPGFYIASRECTIQNFADYLNDLGVNNVGTISNQLFLPLDKNGLLADYPGTLITLLIGNVIDPSQGGPYYNNSIWNVPTKTVTINGSSVSTLATASTSNYPMSYISFYGAYDYGYWMSKNSNIGTVTRLSTRGLPTEMQWEAAARSITNGFTSQAAFTNSSSTTKNGLFPYSFPNQTYNSGLNGTENTAIDLLKVISLYSGFNTPGTDMIKYGSISLLPTGNLTPNPLYIYDLSGNVQEWILDNYQTQNLSFGIIGSYFTSPVNLNGAAQRVVRGGNSTSQASYCSNVYRIGLDANTLNAQTGFRAVINN